ncbi:hypothetical protein [Aquimarina agarilytica]|uniref:hypothetical protein n=1 Tax=Aquimarina agarilytica TaxID=1087449 RepID=UPI0002898813|nr:hypothetical protein [Aquimarina agarilytica]
MELIISLLTGAVGGNLAGALLKKYSMGTLWNSVIGILGGGLGAQLLGMLGIDLGGIVGSIAGGGVGGGVLMAIIGVIKGAMNKN